jgi:two-component system sensor histidine kinase PrrB
VHAPGAHIVVRVRRDDDVAEIVVEDAGRGIPDEQRPAMLQPDVRGPRTVAPGHGLGLPSAAAAMSAQGGRLRLDESCAGGVRAVLLLPAVGCAADAMAC